MFARCLSALLFGLGLVCAPGCKEESACTAELHCHLVDGSPTCDDGFAWENPDDPDNLLCIAIDLGCVCDLAPLSCDPGCECDSRCPVPCSSTLLDEQLCPNAGVSCGVASTIDECGVSRAVVCRDCAAAGCGDPWSPGETAFIEGTTDWGLTTLGATGNRLSVVDFDGDGFADILARRTQAGGDDFSIPERFVWLLRNTGAGQFEDVTQSSGLLQRRSDPGATRARPITVAVFGDVDNDGDLDAFTGTPRDQSAAALGETTEVMFNNGDGTFSLGPEINGIRSVGVMDVPAGASFVDVDRDGDLDLWVSQAAAVNANGNSTLLQDRLYRNDGTGVFDEISAAAGLTTSNWNDLEALNGGLGHSRAWGATACDLNNDARAELLVPSYGRAPNHLWQATGEATYVNRSVASGYAFDSDQTWEDNEFARCWCAANRQAEECAYLPESRLVCDADPARYWGHADDREPFRLGGNSASVICGDVNNDGWQDLLTGEIRHWWAGRGADGSELLINLGSADVGFARPGDAALGLAIAQPSANWDEGHMTGALFDFDNDGWLDVYQGASDYAGNHGRLYHQSEVLAFAEVPIDQGIDHHRSHGVAVADFDHDGDLDVVVGHSRARCDANAADNCYTTEQIRLFENTLGQRNNWLELELVGGAATNRVGIGARVTATACGFTQSREVGGGHGHFGAQNELLVHFGVGDAATVDVTVRWPDLAATIESFTVDANNRYRVTAGSAPVALP